MNPLAPTLPLARRLRRRVRSGFSLVEIMVVIAIIGLLMTVVGVNVVARYIDAQIAATKIQMGQVQQELEIYSTKHKGKYPSTSEGLAAMKKYFPNEEVPQDAWGNDFEYFSPGTHGDHPWEVISMGSDGKEGGSDNAADIDSWDMKDKS